MFQRFLLSDCYPDEPPNNRLLRGFALFLLDENFNLLEEVQAIGESNIGFDYQATSGTYYVETASLPDEESWKYPYAYSISHTPASPLIANFSSNLQEGCESFSVNFSNQSSGDITNYEWTFEGGTPSTSTLENPAVTYNSSGIYNVTLTITDIFGNNTVTQNDYVTVSSFPQAEFTFDAQMNELTFSNETQFGIDIPSYSWDFGDGETSNDISPTHIYQNDGTYTIELTATNSCGSSTYTQTVTIMTLATESINLKSEITIFPNPSRDNLVVNIQGQYLGEYQITLINQIGQVVYEKESLKIGNELEVNLNTFNLPSGTYFIQVTSEWENLVSKIVKL